MGLCEFCPYKCEHGGDHQLQAQPTLTSTTFFLSSLSLIFLSARDALENFEAKEGGRGTNWNEDRPLLI